MLTTRIKSDFTTIRKLINAANDLQELRVLVDLVDRGFRSHELLLTDLDWPLVADEVALEKARIEGELPEVPEWRVV